MEEGEMNDAIKKNGVPGEKENNGTQNGKQAKAGMFKESDYVPFMAGVFAIGGFFGLPLTFGFAVQLEYLAALPWSLASCAVFLIAFRKNGTISWKRAITAMIAWAVAGNVYHESTGKPAFGAGGFLGFILVMICGYMGVGIGRIFGTGKG
jgi:hypothetical protein